jgi:hypothetical protein
MRKWYVASCPNWYCSLVSDAGGALLLDAAGRSALNDADFAALAATADIFVFTGSSWETDYKDFVPSAAATPAGAAAAAKDKWLADLFATMPAMVNKRVYDILGGGSSAWFEARPLNSDALLQELALLVQPIAASAAGFARSPALHFLRNVAVEGAATLPAASQCPRGVAGSTAPAALLSMACPGGGSAAAGLPVGAIVGGVVGGAAGVALLALVAYKLLVAQGAGGAAKAVLSTVEGTTAATSVAAPGSSV